MFQYKILEDFIFMMTQLLIMFGPLIGFVSQYNLISQKHSLGSFSTDVCRILIFSNILRIFFWVNQRFGKFYEAPLLFQSIFMIIMQFMLMKKCLEVMQLKLYRVKNVSFMEQPMAQFWRWTDFISYVQVCVLFSLALGIISYYLRERKDYWELIGMLSAIIEASLGVPQMLRNFQQKSTAGLSYIMISTWFFGDAFKSVYYILNQSPKQFLYCGLTQLIIDIVIMGQITKYGDKMLIEL